MGCDLVTLKYITFLKKCVNINMMLDSKYSHYSRLVGLSEVIREKQVNPHTLKVGRDYVQFILDEPGDFHEITVGKFKGDKKDHSHFLVFSDAVSYRTGYAQLGSNYEWENYSNQPVLLLYPNGRDDNIFLKPENAFAKAEISRGFVLLGSENTYNILEDSGLGKYVQAARKERIPSRMSFTPAGDIQKIVHDVNKVHAFLVSLENTLRRI